MTVEVPKYMLIEAINKIVPEYGTCPEILEDIKKYMEMGDSTIVSFDASSGAILRDPADKEDGYYIWPLHGPARKFCGDTALKLTALKDRIVHELPGVGFFDLKLIFELTPFDFLVTTLYEHPCYKTVGTPPVSLDHYGLPVQDYKTLLNDWFDEDEENEEEV